MKILIYSVNYAPELTGIGKYNGELAACLAGSGIDTTVLTAPPYYPEWRHHQGFKNWWAKGVEASGVSVFRAPLYVPKRVTTVTRLLHLASFACSSALSLVSLIKLKPDVVFLVQPTLFCAPAALLYSRITGAKAIMHIQDFEVDAMFALRMGKEGWFSSLARKAEVWLTSKFDAVSSISYSMMDNAKAKGVADDKLIFFPNWADTDFITPDSCGDAIRQQWGYAETDSIVLYSGNIGRKQGLEIVLDAAKAFAHRVDVKFLIIGDGAYSEVLAQLVMSMGLSNVQFKPLQPWELMPQILAMADVHLVTQLRGAADVVMPSKLTNILSAGGHVLVTADPDTELGKIAKRFSGIYTCVEPENLNAFVSGLNECLSFDGYNMIGRQYAVDNLNRRKILERFIGELEVFGD